MNPSLSFTLLALASTGAVGLGLRQDPAAAPTQSPSVRSDVDDLFDTDDADADDLDEAPEVADMEDEADEPEEVDAEELDGEVGGDFGDLASLNGNWNMFEGDQDGAAEWNVQGADELREHQHDLEALREALEEQREALEESRQAFEESRRGWAESMRAHEELSRELGARLARARDAQGAQHAKALRLREKIAQRGLAGKIAAAPSAPRGMGTARVVRPGTTRGFSPMAKGGKGGRVTVLGGSGGGSCGPTCESKCETKCETKCQAACESSGSQGCATGFAPSAPTEPATDATPASPGVVYWRNGDGQGYTMFNGDYDAISKEAYRAAQDALSAADWSHAYAGQVVDKAAIERSVEEARAAGAKAGAYAFDGNGLVSLCDLGGVWSTESGEFDAEAAHRLAESAREMAHDAKAMAEREVAVARGQGRAAGRVTTTGPAVAVVPDWSTPSGDAAPASDTMNELTSLIREMSSEVRGLRDDLRSLREDLHRERGGELR